MKNNFKIISLLVVFGFSFLACGGGGNTEPLNDNPILEDNTTSENILVENSSKTRYAPQILLKEGEFWEYKWQSAKTTAAQGSDTTVDNKNGSFFVKVGTPIQIKDREAFPLTIEGNASTYLPRWTHLATGDDGSLLGYTNGVFKTIYSATESTWMGGGFFIDFADDVSVKVANSTYTGIYNTLDAVLVSHSDSSGGCEYLLGETLCSEDSASTRLKEYYKQGLGTVGYYEYSYYSYSGGNFFSAYTTEVFVELVSSSFKAVDGSELKQPSWKEEAILKYEALNPSAVLLDNKIYILGDNNTNLQVYNVVTQVFEDDILLLLSGTYNKLHVLDGYLYVRNDKGVNKLIDTEVGSWEYQSDYPSSSSSTTTTWEYYSSEYNSTFDYTVNMSPTNGISSYHNISLYIPSSMSTSTYIDPEYNYNRWGWFEIEEVKDILYMIGGSYLSDSTWNTWSTHDNIARFDLVNNLWLSSATKMNESREYGFAKLEFNDKLIIFGGSDHNGKKLATVEEYNTTTDKWTNLEPLLEPLTSIVAVATESKIYVISKTNILVFTPN